MNKILIVTVLATDRPGIVKTLSEAILAHKANWIESRMADLANKFAGLIEISVPEDQIDGLQQRLKSLHDADNQLQILMEEASEEPQTEERELSLELIGADRPGIIGDITNVLAKLDVNINELHSEQREASMSNEVLFYAHLTLGLGPQISDDDVQDALEAMRDQFMIDINFAA